MIFIILNVELEIGLYGGKGKGEGRVEITMNGFRGTVCSRGWTDKDASVYCKMLGYGCDNVKHK